MKPTPGRFLSTFPAALLLCSLKSSFQNWFHACFFRQSLLPLLSFIPSARQNVNEIILIKNTLFLHSKKRRHCKQVRRFLPDIDCWLSSDTEKIPAENLGQFVTECNASRNFE